jgi:hypothetical protein
MNGAPVLSELEALRLEGAIAQLENAQLKIHVLQERARTVQATINTLVQAAHREGYTLRRLEDGSGFVYVPVDGAARVGLEG